MSGARMFKELRDFIRSIRDRDPAARSTLEVLFCYPGVHALAFYRAAHWLWQLGFTTLARFVSHIGRLLTGIEIHPAATIGRRLFIDHGMGVVIGETSVVGNDVTLYQSVTLGGTSLAREKRHPTLEDGVIVGAGAQILGPVRVGAGARIGANAVVVKDVAPGATMVGIPARAAGEKVQTQPPVAPVSREARGAEFCAYGTPSTDLPDPVARAIDALCQEVAVLKARVAELEAERAPEERAAGGQIGH
ncbi:MAG: serine O-acetyltransferase [Gemmatimonas sp.]